MSLSVNSNPSENNVIVVSGFKKNKANEQKKTKKKNIGTWEQDSNKEADLC